MVTIAIGPAFPCQQPMLLQLHLGFLRKPSLRLSIDCRATRARGLAAAKFQAIGAPTVA